MLGCAKKVQMCSGANMTYITISCHRNIIEVENLKYTEAHLKFFDSEIIHLSRKNISDLTDSRVFGRITELEDSEFYLPFTIIVARNISSGILYETISDIDANYELKLPESEYELEFRFLGFNTLKTQQLFVKNGEETHLSVALGEGMGITAYQMTDKDFIKKLDDKKK